MAGYHSLPSSANSDIGDCNSKEFVERDFALNGIASDGADGHNYTKRTQGAAKLTSIKLPSTAPKKQAPCFFMKLVPCLKKLLTEKKENPESANQVDSPSEPQEKCATTTSEIQEPHRFFSEALCDSGLDELASKAHTVGLRIDLTSGRTPTVQNFTTIAFAEPREHLRPQYLAAQDAYINALIVVDDNGKPTKSRVVRELSAEIPIERVKPLKPRSKHPRFLHVVFVLDETKVPGSKDFAVRRRSYKEETGIKALLLERSPTREELAASRLAEAESKCIAWAGFSSYRVLWYHVTSAMRKGFEQYAYTRGRKLSEL